MVSFYRIVSYHIVSENILWAINFTNYLNFASIFCNNIVGCYCPKEIFVILIQNCEIHKTYTPWKLALFTLLRTDNEMDIDNMAIVHLSGVLCLDIISYTSSS